MPAVPGLPPPPELVLRRQTDIVLPHGLVRTPDARIWCQKDGAEMVLVPAGEFLMGVEEGTVTGIHESQWKDGQPAHRVFLSSFLIDRHETTVGQFRRFCAETDREMPDDYSHKEPSHPVGNVGWRLAVAYSEWAGKRLPTEAEWEKAARGTDARIYPWGNDEPSNARANYSRSGSIATTPVGSFTAGASPYGCFDMAGNLWEWCADTYERGYYTHSPTRDPQGPSSGGSIWVTRGGSFYGPIHNMRCDFRSWGDAGGLNSGFRCAKSLP